MIFRSSRSSLSPPPRSPLAPASLTHLGQDRPNDRAVKTFRQQHHDRCLLSSQRRQLRIKGGLARNGEHHTVAMAKKKKTKWWRMQQVVRVRVIMQAVT